MKQHPLISVIIPFYNSIMYLQESIQSVLNQSYQNLEIIMIDNDSCDGSSDVAKEFANADNRIKYYVCKTRGVAAARNMGLMEATGEYLAFVDSDDLLTESAIQILLELALREDADFVMSTYYPCYEGKIQNEKFMSIDAYCTTEKIEAHRFFLTKGKSFCHMWGNLYKKELFENIQFPEGKIYEDIAVFPSILENVKKLVCVNIPTYYYRIYTESICYVSKMEQQIDGLYAGMDNARLYEKKYSSLTTNAYEYVLVIGFFLLGRIYRSGFKKNQIILDKTIEQINEARHKITRKSIYIKGALLVFDINPKLAGFVFAWYSRIKNHTK